MINTIIFDLDGTLTTSIDNIIKGFEYTIKKFFPEIKLNMEDKTSFVGRTLIDNFKIYTKDSKLLQEMEKTYRTFTNELNEKMLNTYPNAKNVVKYLMNKNIKVGIVTSKAYEVAVKDLKTVGLYKYFNVIVGYEQTKKHKPNPDSLLMALDCLQSKPEESVYVGDHENDIKAAHAAGMQSVAVTYSYRLKEMLLEQPTYVIDDLENLKDLI